MVIPIVIDKFWYEYESTVWVCNVIVEKIIV